MFREHLGRLGFYIAFACVVTASVQIVGVYLVFASLIIPVLSSMRLKGFNRLFGGYLIGAISYFAGIVLSALLDLPTGAVIVWTMAVVGIIAGYVIHLGCQSSQSN
jgi:zinc/manganese transport system permease protein